MPTDKAAADTLLAQLSTVANANMKPMFGEQFAPELERASRHPGAKAAFIMPLED